MLAKRRRQLLFQHFLFLLKLVRWFKPRAGRAVNHVVGFRLILPQSCQATLLKTSGVTYIIITSSLLSREKHSLPWESNIYIWPRNQGYLNSCYYQTWHLFTCSGEGREGAFLITLIPWYNVYHVSHFQHRWIAFQVVLPGQCLSSLHTRSCDKVAITLL